jgi:hypothetical protein
MKLSVVDQVLTALGIVATDRTVNLVAMSLAFPLAVFVPLASWRLAHFEVVDNPTMWIGVIGCVIFSAITVFMWCEEAFQNRWKAVGYVLLTEIVLVFSVTPWLQYCALSILIVINWLATGCILVAARQQDAEEVLVESTAPAFPQMETMPMQASESTPRDVKASHHQNGGSSAKTILFSRRKVARV